MRTGGKKGDRSLHLLHRIIPQERDADMGSHFLDLFNESVDDHCEDHDLRDVDRETRFTQLIKAETNLISSPTTPPEAINPNHPHPPAPGSSRSNPSHFRLTQLFTPSRILTQKPPMTSTNPKPRCRASSDPEPMARANFHQTIDQMQFRIECSIRVPSKRENNHNRGEERRSASASIIQV
ncbi:hypothetical protein BJ742DRAFT_319497 [Cladochytrium replicatum]|nr:hypothetical protein BJ742DRAFT_319497 [Cladochytrium replicatum]